MRKLIFVLSVILIFVGCSKAPAEPQDVSKAYQADFSAAVNAECGEENFKIKIQKNGTSISFYVEEPENLAGLSISLDGEHASVSYKDIQTEFDVKNLPEKAPFLLLLKLFDELSSPEEFVLSTAGDELFAQGKDFAAVLSSEDFSLINAVFPEYETEFEFFDFKFSFDE